MSHLTILNPLHPSTTNQLTSNLLQLTSQYFVEMAVAKELERALLRTQQPDAEGMNGASTTDVEACYSLVYRGAACAFEAKGLLPATAYAFRVSAANCAGTGPWGGACRVKTAPAAPGPVDGEVSALAESSSAIRVSWRPPSEDNGSPVATYVVEMAAAAGAGSGSGGSNRRGGSNSSSNGPAAASWSIVYSGSATTCVIGRLGPGREFLFRVRAGNACGLGPANVPAASASTAPAAPSAPLRLQCLQRAAQHLRVKWDAPDADNGAPVVEYQLELGQQQGGAEADNGGAGAVRHQRRSSSGGVGGGGSSDGAANLSGGGGPISWCLAYSGRDESARIGDLDPASRYWLRVQVMMMTASS